MKVFMTGITGFCGDHFAAMVHDTTDWHIEARTRSTWNIREPWPFEKVPANVDYFLHFAANVKARESLAKPGEFVLDNVVGTFNVLELARRVKPKLFVYLSSAEAVGGCDKGYLDTDAPLRPSNPYAATKGAGELLTYSYFRSYQLPAIIVRTQCLWSLDLDDDSKAVTILRKKIMAGETVEVFSKDSVPGSRQWIKIDDFCTRLIALLPNAVPGETYHIVGQERNNLEMASLLAKELGVPMLCRIVQMSPTHEFRYALKDMADE